MMDKKGDPKTKAKLDVLEYLRNMAQKLMQEDLDSSGMEGDEMQKVMVAAPDEEGLEEGLETAKDVISGLPSSDEEAHESAEEGEDMASIEAQIAALEAKKRQLMSS